MTNYQSNQNRDWTATQAAPRRTRPRRSHHGGLLPPDVGAPERPGHPAGRPGSGVRSGLRPALPGMVGRAARVQLGARAYAAPQPWYARTRVLAFAGAGLVAAAAAGLFGALHSSSHSTPVNTSAQSAPAPAAAPRRHRHRHPCPRLSRRRRAIGRRRTRRRAAATPSRQATRRRRRPRRLPLRPRSSSPISRSGTTTVATARGTTGVTTATAGGVTTTTARTTRPVTTTATTATRPVSTTATTATRR
jgi:hypothetical protein